MLMFIVGFAACYFVMGIAVLVFEEVTDSMWASDLFKPVYAILIIIITPFVFLWKMVLRFMFHPVTEEHFNKTMEGTKVTFKKFGKLRFCHDRGKAAITNKFFVVRLK